MWASVDTVAQGDDRILRAGLNGLKEGLEGGQAAMDVTNRNREDQGIGAFNS